VTDSAIAQRTYLVFRLGDEQYALPVERVSGVVRFEAPTPVPRSADSVMGVVNLRGAVIPVVDLARRFLGRDFAETPLSRIVVSESGGSQVGLAVDMAKEVARISSDEVKPVPEGVLEGDAAGAFVGVVERGDSLVILLDLDAAVARPADATRP